MNLAPFVGIGAGKPDWPLPREPVRDMLPLDSRAKKSKLKFRLR